MSRQLKRSLSKNCYSIINSLWTVNKRKFNCFGYWKYYPKRKLHCHQNRRCLRNHRSEAPYWKSKFPHYPLNKNIYPVFCLKKYLETTKLMRRSITSLFIASLKLSKPVSTDIVASWIRSTIAAAGINAK